MFVGEYSTGEASAATDRPIDRRERRREAMRRRLADSALRLALERGADSVTVEQISDAADIAPRTFFNYFPSREAALLPAQEARLEVLRAALVSQAADADPVAGTWHALTSWALDGDLASADTLPRLRVALQSRTLNPRYLARYAAIEAVIAGHLGDRLTGADTAAALAGGETAAVRGAAPAGAETAAVRAAALAAALVGVFRAAVRCWALDQAAEGRNLQPVLDEAFEAAFGMRGSSC
jgi:AcrR family transcriptional regulator